MLTEDFFRNGFDLPRDASKITKGAEFLEQTFGPMTDTWEEPCAAQIEAAREYVDSHDHTVFRSRGLVLLPDLEGLKVALYRHPSLWHQSVQAKGKPRGFDWYVEFHRRLIACGPDVLLNHSDYDAGYFPRTVYTERRIRQREIRETPAEALEVYAEMGRIRKEKTRHMGGSFESGGAFAPHEA